MFYDFPLIFDAYSGLFGCRSGIGFIDLRILRPDPKISRPANLKRESNRFASFWCVPMIFLWAFQQLVAPFEASPR
jgi:hypothetical protein